MDKRYYKKQKMLVILSIIVIATLVGCGIQDVGTGVGSANKQEESRLETTWLEPIVEEKEFCTIKTVKNGAKDVRVAVGAPQESVTAAWLCRSTDGEEYTVVNEAYNLEKEGRGICSDGVWYDSLVERQGKYFYRMIYQLSDETNVGSNIVTLYRLNRPKVRIIHTEEGKAKVSWAKNAEADGYQVQYAEDKTFSSPSVEEITQNEVTTFLMPKDGSCEWVKVRCYKTVDNKIYYSAWSRVKNTLVEK